MIMIMKLIYFVGSALALGGLVIGTIIFYNCQKKSPHVQIYFCIPEIFRMNISNRFLTTRSLLNLYIFLRCEFTRVILQSKGWFEMFVLELSGIRYIFELFIKCVFKVKDTQILCLIQIWKIIMYVLIFNVMIL